MGDRLGSLGANSLSAQSRAESATSDLLPSQVFEAFGKVDDCGQAPIVALAGARVRTHLDIGSKSWLGKQEVASLNAGLTKCRGGGPLCRANKVSWEELRTE